MAPVSPGQLEVFRKNHRENTHLPMFELTIAQSSNLMQSLTQWSAKVLRTEPNVDTISLHRVHHISQRNRNGRKCEVSASEAWKQVSFLTSLVGCFRDCVCQAAAHGASAVEAFECSSGFCVPPLSISSSL